MVQINPNKLFSQHLGLRCSSEKSIIGEILFICSSFHKEWLSTSREFKDWDALASWKGYFSIFFEKLWSSTRRKTYVYLEVRVQNHFTVPYHLSFRIKILPISLLNYVKMWFYSSQNLSYIALNYLFIFPFKSLTFQPSWIDSWLLLEKLKIILFTCLHPLKKKKKDSSWILTWNIFFIF